MQSLCLVADFLSFILILGLHEEQRSSREVWLVLGWTLVMQLIGLENYNLSLSFSHVQSLASNYENSIKISLQLISHVFFTSVHLSQMWSHHFSPLFKSTLVTACCQHTKFWASNKYLNCCVTNPGLLK